MGKLTKGAIPRKALERKIRAAAVVSEWKRRSKKNRCSVTNLALELGLTRRVTQKMIDSPPKTVKQTREKLKVVREVASRVRAPRRSFDTATKVATDLKIKEISVQSVRRLRRPYRDKEMVLRKAQIQENRRRARLFAGEDPEKIASQARSQGW